MTIQELLKNKSARLALGITAGIGLLVIILSPKKSSAPVSRELSSPAPRTELINLSEEKRRTTMIYVDQIEAKLPLYLENFKTSVGINTTINIYRLDSDEAEVVRLEIYGLSYLNTDSNEAKNPNVTAYKESYAKAMEMLESKNIDPKRLIFIYGDKEYVTKTANRWISDLKLSP